MMFLQNSKLRKFSYCIIDLINFLVSIFFKFGEKLLNFFIDNILILDYGEIFMSLKKISFCYKHRKKKQKNFSLS
jgi:hypothetical protein